MSYTRERIHEAEVFVSEILESHGIPDPYIWRIKDGKLVPQNSDNPIENIIIVDNPIGKIEYEAFQLIQNRVAQMDSGDYVLWISPTDTVYYPKTSKIVITQKIGDTLLNRSINTDWDALGSILAAKEFAIFSSLEPDIFKNPNDVRANPIFINKDKEAYLGLALKKMLDQRSIEMMASGEDFKVKEKYMAYSLRGESIQMGQNPLSCPTRMKGRSAFEIFAGKDEYGSLQFECPTCHKTNTREPGKLLSNCQHCGCDVSCGIASAA